MVYALGRLQNPTLRHSLTSQQFHCLSELITLQTNISLRGAYIKTTLSVLHALFYFISIGNRLLFCNFRIESRVQNRKQSDEAKQYSFNSRFAS